MNPLPFRADLGCDPSLEELIERIRSASTEAYAHQQIPLEILIDELTTGRGLGEEPLFGILFQLRNYGRRRLRTAGGLSVMPFEFDAGIASLELSVDWEEQGDGLLCGFTYRNDLFDEATVASWMAHYRTILETVAENPDKKLSEL